MCIGTLNVHKFKYNNERVIELDFLNYIILWSPIAKQGQLMYLMY